MTIEEIKEAVHSLAFARVLYEAYRHDYNKTYDPECPRWEEVEPDVKRRWSIVAETAKAVSDLSKALAPR